MQSFHLDPLGGVAGDMFVAAVIDLRPDLEAGLRDTLSRCPLIEDVSVTFPEHNDGILTGRRFLAARSADPPSPPLHRQTIGHHHHHDSSVDDRKTQRHVHDHVAWREIRSALKHAPLDPAVIRHSIGIFKLLAEAEAEVHGTTPENVSFHEVGAWDLITDIVGAAYLISQLEEANWTIGPLPLGSGRLMTAHGQLPVPAPATALLMQGIATIDDGVGGERVTPTGAAIVRYLCNRSSPPSIRTLLCSGYGFGTRRLAGISNCLRILCFERIELDAVTETLAVIEFEIDDQTAEDLSHGIEQLRKSDGVLDVVQSAVFGKKGRMMTSVRILARQDAVHAVARSVFEETSTIGVRYSPVHRMVLPRESGMKEGGGRVLRVKTTTRPGGRTTKIEADDLADIPSKATRDALRGTVEIREETEVRHD